MIQAPWLTHTLSILERKVAIHPFGVWSLVYNNNNDFGTENFLRVNEWLAWINSPNHLLKSINSIQLHINLQEILCIPSYYCFNFTKWKWMDASLELGKKLGHHCVWPPGYHYFFFQAHFLHFTWFSFWLHFAAWQKQQQQQLAS